MDTRTQILALVGATILGITHALDAKVPYFMSMKASYRLLLASGLGIASGVVDALVNGTPFVQSLVTVFAVSGPAFVVLLVSAVGDAISGASGSGPTGSGNIDLQAPNRKSVNPPAPYSTKMVAVVIAVAMAASGCNVGIPKAITDVRDALTDVGFLIDAIRAAEGVFFAVKPNVDLQRTIDKDVAAVALAADAALRAVNGADALTKQQVDAAFDNFKKTYSDLYTLLSSSGVVGADGKFSATAGGGAIRLPEPLAFSLGNR